MWRSGWAEREVTNGQMLPAFTDEAVVHVLVGELWALLQGADVADARTEARDMVAALLDVSRLWPGMNPDAVVASDLAERARSAARRRANGEPFAYAVGRAAFRYLTLSVDPRVLIPRQETEILVDIVLRELGDAPGGVAVDVGTGSGAIALALASESRLERVIATDVSSDALAVAGMNVEQLLPRLRARVELRQGAGLGPVRNERLRAVVANPPYIAFDESAQLPSSVRDWEPPLALYAADAGMANTIELISGAARLLEPGGLLAVELDSRRADAGAELARADGRYERVAIHPDLSGRDRVLTARRRAESG